MNAQWMLNPRLEKPSVDLLKLGEDPLFNNHFFFSSSGSTAAPKWIALSQKALEASALAVNAWLEVTSRDVFGLCLPTFHVGGYGMVERARVSGALLKRFEAKWNAVDFHSWLIKEEVSVLSLVPTQVYDLIFQKLKAPTSLRIVVVGGGALAKSLFIEARQLGWPLLISYGLTECASQVATASLSSLDSNSLVEDLPPAFLLPHVTLKKIGNENFQLKSEALLTAYIKKERDRFFIDDPKNDGFFLLPDKIETNIKGEKLQVFVKGRWEENFKILGELVDYGALKKLFYEETYKLGLWNALELGIFAHPRQEHCLALICENFGQAEKAFLKEFNLKVAPFERITHFYEGLMPRSELGKILLRKINPVCLQEYSG
jgi:O-succinylbenzoic acid--CoA ligase